MALKDWKKVSDQDNKWTKRNNFIQIIEDRTGRDASIVKSYIVDIFEFETADGNSRGFEKTFKTKSEALAYAKTYMRSH